MALLAEEKQAIFKRFGRFERDTGSTPSQVALLTYHIQKLTQHFKVHKRDKHGKRGLTNLVSRRRKLLSYLHRTQPQKYAELIKALGLRR